MSPMKRGRRWMLNGLMVVSLILALLVAGLWVGSYWRGFTIAKYDARTKTECWVSLAAGGLFFASVDTGRNVFFNGPTLAGFDFVSDDPRYVVTHCAHDFLGFGWGDRYPRFRQFDNCFSVPLWFLFILAARLPGIRLARIFSLYRRLRRRKRLPATGHCQKCGYDLRATPNRCPECGTVPTAGTSAER